MIGLVDGRAALRKAISLDANFLLGANNINTLVSEHDGMLKTADMEYYLFCGRSALKIVKDALDRDFGFHKVAQLSILDFACGYGRVTRWLHSSFGESLVKGYDVDERAVQALNKILPGTSRLIAKDWSDVPSDLFDVIWVGSLFTHLDQKRFEYLLNLLEKRMKNAGLLIFTSHGEYVYNRLATGEKTYGLGAKEIQRVCDAYGRDGYGFEAYAGSKDYGISISKISCVTYMLEKAGFSACSYFAKGWVSHQDVFIARKGEKK